MTTIRLVTDPTVNMPDEMVRANRLTIVPVYVLFGDQSFKDYVEMPPEKFYAMLAEIKASGGARPTSS